MIPKIFCELWNVSSPWVEDWCDRLEKRSLTLSPSHVSISLPILVINTSTLHLNFRSCFFGHPNLLWSDELSTADEFVQKSVKRITSKKGEKLTRIQSDAKRKCKLKNILEKKGKREKLCLLFWHEYWNCNKQILVALRLWKLNTCLLGTNSTCFEARFQREIKMDLGSPHKNLGFLIRI